MIVHLTIALSLTAAVGAGYATDMSGAGGAEDTGGVPSQLGFPPGFRFGAATSSYQIEGAWNVSDKGESVWDRWVRQAPSPVQDGSSGDVACDSYHLWPRDVEMVTELGLDFYRFSISWSRILPSGFPNKVSQDGVAYYKRLIDGLLQRGVEPVVTMYHFELPQTLQDLGGWVNPLIVDWFADYARVLFSLFASRVTTWITINEPIMVCDYVYGTGFIAPAVREPLLAPFLCNKHVLLAHAKVWRIYDELYRPQYHGKISLAINPVWIEPATPADRQLADLAREFGAGRYSHPIYSAHGGWPPALVQVLADYSHRLGLPRSVLPPLSDDEVLLIRGTSDFYSLNHYTSRTVRAGRAGESAGVWPFTGARELGAVLENDPRWPTSPLQDLAVVPEGVRRQIAWLRERYGNISILISENGFPGTAVGLQDYDRVHFMKGYLKQVLLSVEDGADVLGYTAWSLMDNFEWNYGYRLKFGLYEVDFSSPRRTRTPRASALFYKDLIRRRALS